MRADATVTLDRSAPAALPRPASDPAEVSAEIARLDALDLHELRIRWRKLFRTKAPAHLPAYLLRRILVYRVQANAFGDLDRETVRLLDHIARNCGSGDRDKPAVPPVPEWRGLKPGSVLVREHEGHMHRVTVAADGFAWNGSTYTSLSEIARAITGTRWNGPRFFGLRDRPARTHAQESRA